MEDNNVNFINNSNNNKSNIKKNIVCVILIIFGLTMIIVGLYLLEQKSNKEQIEVEENYLYSFEVRGYELDKPFVLDEYYYNIEVKEDVIQIVCNIEGNVEGCNKEINLKDEDEYIHKIILKNNKEEKVYTLKIKKIVEEVELRITSIDGNPLEWTNKDVEIEVKALSNYGILGYSFDGGKTFQESNKIKIENNKTLSIVIKDKKGNTTDPKEVKIDKIDKEKPKVEVTIENKTKNEIKLKVVSKDSDSGIEGISFNDSAYTTNDVYTITKTGKYKIKVKDKAGNISDEILKEIKQSDFGKIEKVFTATFHKNGANITKENLNCSTSEDSCEVTLPTITRDGYEILGWSINKDSKTAKYKSGEKITLTKDVDYYAITKKTIKITFNSNGATISTTSKTCDLYNTSSSCNITTPTITRDGYEILGWSTNKDSKTASVKASTELSISSNQTYYAITKKNIKITFNSNGAAIGAPGKTCDLYNTSSSCNITTPTITRDGYEILGWSTNKDSKTASVKVSTELSISLNQTYYAITKKNIKITFNSNGAAIGAPGKTCDLYNTSSSCNITTPTITRDGYEILGWSTNKDSKTASVKVSTELSISSNQTYYAITKKNIKITFNLDVTQRTCVIYNKQEECSVVMPEFNIVGAFNGAWGLNKDNTEAKYRVGTAYSFSSDTNLYASVRHPWGDNPDAVQRKVRNISMQKTIKIGSKFIEYDEKIPVASVNNHILFLQNLYQDFPFLFIPGKVFVMDSKTYYEYSYSYGLTPFFGSYSFVDIQYDANGKIDLNATVHELVHTWDFYYSFRTGKSIHEQEDFKDFYESISTKLGIDNTTEIFAAMFTNYYWHVLEMDTSKVYYALCTGCTLNETEKHNLKTIMEKYMNISNNGY